MNRSPESSSSVTQPPSAGETAIDRDSRCMQCGYNLRGLFGDPVRCPECGHANGRAELQALMERVAVWRQHWSRIHNRPSKSTNVPRIEPTITNTETPPINQSSRKTLCQSRPI
jgi:hypothetical protein